jgi:hypothetical protein
MCYAHLIWPIVVLFAFLGGVLWLSTVYELFIEGRVIELGTLLQLVLRLCYPTSDNMAVSYSCVCVCVDTRTRSGPSSLRSRHVSSYTGVVLQVNFQVILRHSLPTWAIIFHCLDTPNCSVVTSLRRPP